MIVGFTGTRTGMTKVQRDLLLAMLMVLKSHGGTNELHHGDEEHADSEAADIGRATGYAIVPHPPAAKTAEELLARNRIIVELSSVLIAAPKTNKEEIRSGTWYTVRRMLDAEKPVVILPRGRKG